MNAPARTWGGSLQIHPPPGPVYQEQKDLIESFGIVILKEIPSAGETTLLVYAPHASVKSLLQNPDISVIRVQIHLSFWPLEKGVPLTSATILKGPGRNGADAFH